MEQDIYVPLVKAMVEALEAQKADMANEFFILHGLDEKQLDQVRNFITSFEGATTESQG